MLSLIMHGAVELIGREYEVYFFNKVHDMQPDNKLLCHVLLVIILGETSLKTVLQWFIA